LYSGCKLLTSYWWHTLIIRYWISFMCSCGGRARRLLYIKNFKIFHIYYLYFFNFGLGITFNHHFNSVLVYAMV
jgi:hypothetical protein